MQTKCGLTNFTSNNSAGCISYWGACACCTGMHQTCGVLLCSNEYGQVGYCALETEASNFESYFAVDIACVAGSFFWCPFVVRKVKS